MKFAFYTLGCKTNQFETAALELLCREKGHTLVPFDRDADVYVINTCTVTGTGGRKSRAVIRRAKAFAANRRAVVVVCGCLGQTSPELAAQAGADIVCGVSDRALIIERAVSFLSNLAEQNNHLSSPDKNSPAQPAAHTDLSKDSPLASPQFFVPEPSHEFELLPADGVDGRTRALLKIEDGCNNFCSYCIIPHARGRVRSISLCDAVSETVRLRDAGFRETVITGIEISSYGQDTGESFAELVKSVCAAAAPSMRIRLGSLEPRTITDQFCKSLSSSENLCPHFHLALQSGCDSTLRRMNRKYSTQRFFESVLLLRKYFKNCAITTDLIVGFPGETDQEFTQTLEFIEKCGFSDMHIFPYSKRDGTPAASMPGQISNSEKGLRAKSAAIIAQKMRLEFFSKMVGQTASVLFEQKSSNGEWLGHCDNYCLVRAFSEQNLHNRLCRTYISSFDDDGLIGRPV